MSVTGKIRGLQHVGLVVPDVSAATEFFVSGLGAEPLFSVGPIEVDDERAERYDVKPGCTLVSLAMLRIADGPNLELIQFETDTGDPTPPRNDQAGGHHLAFQVDDIDETARQLLKAGASRCGTPANVLGGPFDGLGWHYLRTPWGSYVELVAIPDDGIGFERGGSQRLFRP
ncbi:MAG: hypothetical protein F4222_08340 [Gammaproteobacteria bacterium]|nr:hypothetical protein [Gammaproteobacteria bacterium]MYF59061.1 hypothetical protein [Gammaproteobacteria bacterium]